MTDTPTRPDFSAIQAICARQIAKAGEPKPPRCEGCEDHGLLYRLIVSRLPVSRGVQYWSAARCNCGQALDWGARWENGEKSWGLRPYGHEIPHETDVFDGTRKLSRVNLYTLSERQHAEDRAASASTPEAIEEREAMQDE